MVRGAALAWIALLALCLAAIAWVRPSSAAPLAGAYTSGPVPPWVLAPPVDRTTKYDGDATTIDLVIDDQLRLTKTVERYIRRSRQIATIAGVEHGGEIEVEIDPSYERFVLHGIHIVRGDRRIDAAKTADVRVLDAEDSRDKRLYNGARSIVFLLSDVRVGDVVEWEGSVIGQNPVYSGRFARRFYLGSSRPTLYRRVRVLTPKDRPLQSSSTQPAKSSESGDQIELLWEGSTPPEPPEEHDTPGWFDATPMLSVSEYASWTDVARWATPLYDATAPPGRELSAKIAEIAATNPTQEARALAALRFVQDDIRYLGIELGESSHRPHAASKVLAQRFGDCKDKVMLFVTMLRGLGIEAHAALVDTDADARVREALPGPNAFDHVIARVRIDGRDLWVDPTRNLERGPLGAAPIFNGFALVAAAGTTDLTAIPVAPPAEPGKEVVETFRVEGNDVRLEVVTTYRRLSADSFRADLDAGKRGEIEKHYLEFYEREYPNTKRRSPLVVDDDVAKGVLTTRESYDLPGAFEKQRLATWAETLASVVAKPKVTKRETPLAVDTPYFARHTIIVEGLDLEPPADVTVTDDALEYRLRSKHAPKRLEIVHDLSTKRDHVMPDAVAKHLELRTSIRQALEQDLAPSNADSGDKKKEKKKESSLVDIGVVVVFCAMVLGIGIYAVVHVTRSAVRNARTAGRRWSWIRRSEPDRGHVESKPRRAVDRDEADAALRKEGCECGRRDVAHESSVTWSVVALGEQRITSARIECAACGAPRVRYFELERND